MRSRNGAVAADPHQLDLFSFSPAQRIGVFAPPPERRPDTSAPAPDAMPASSSESKRSIVPPPTVAHEKPLILPPLPDVASTVKESAEIPNKGHYRISDEDQLGEGSLKQKCRANLAAIELLKRLELEGRPASDAEKHLLVRYVGWGGLPQIFDEHNMDWVKPAQHLRELLTDTEFASARATTLNAHYTSPTIIRGMYAALEHLGFHGGRVLEPACGIGHFLGLMPEAMLRQSRFTAIEIDSVTARLARTLYPDADIRCQPFEESKLADDFYDVALSNIPFGDYRPYDPRFKSWNFVIHDYFFAAAMAKVRPGGLIVFITSKGTLDKADPALREYLDQATDFLGAVRLPNDAFKKNANTEVTTDLVILRKRLPGEAPRGQPWRENVPITNSVGETIAVNEFFAAHPEMMLGEMRLVGRMYRQGEPTLVNNGRDLSEQLAEAVARLPREVFVPTTLPSSVHAPAAPFPGSAEIKPNVAERRNRPSRG